jgi:NAD(P)-dependent dehydrogenase (short-subunit alcohol dehydrogenase family)
MTNVDRRTCLITGAGRGIGLAIARDLDRRGYRLALTAQSERSRQLLGAKLASFAASDHLPVLCDVGVEQQILALYAQIDAVFGHLDAVVVNAGIHRQEPSLEIAASDWDRLFAVDVRGAMLCCREAARRMAGRGGSIVVIGSIAGERATPQRACYCAAKAAVHAYVQSVAPEWGPLGIRINVVSPGPIDTEFLAGAVPDPQARAELGRRVPMGRLGTAEDVAAAVRYLLDDQAGFVTGAVLRVDGGRIWT